MVVTALAAVAFASAAQAARSRCVVFSRAEQGDGSYLMTREPDRRLVDDVVLRERVRGLRRSPGRRDGDVHRLPGRERERHVRHRRPAGTIDFSYTFTAKYDPTFTMELHGRCHHPVVGGTGDFAGVTGVLDFQDDPVTGCAYYRGHLDLP